MTAATERVWNLIQDRFRMEIEFPPEPVRLFPKLAIEGSSDLVG